MFTTNYMGLVAWDQGSDPYDHSQLANNFQALDGHDHTVGKGRQIPSAGLQDGSITSAKIAGNAITPDKIPDGSLTQAEFAANSVGTAQIQDNADNGGEDPQRILDLAKLDPEHHADRYRHHVVPTQLQRPASHRLGSPRRPSVEQCRQRLGTTRARCLIPAIASR
jgi:hypothetical protein